MNRKPLPRWIVDTGEEAALIPAHTKSEARAIAKKDFGYPNRLPVGTTVTKTKEVAS